jgi:glycosyltransferase involved in cell wall biosynthesis
MNILFVFPYCAPETNSISGGPIYLASTGHNILVLTARHTKSFKGDVSSPEYEIVNGAEFYRPYVESKDICKQPFELWQTVEKKISEFQPDAVIGFGEFNYKLPLRISQTFGIRLFIFMEYLRPEKVAPPIRGRTFLLKYAPFLHNLASSIFLRYLAKRSAAIMFSYYGDQDRIGQIEKYGTHAYYVPWCTDVGTDDDKIVRNRRTGIYIGSLEPYKNTAELIQAIPLILEHTDTEKFIVVGPGSYAEQIKMLCKRYGAKLEYIESVPRHEALQLIRSAGYGYSPVSDCGLGFIGDCWGTGTPLIMTHQLDGFIRKDVDTIIADGYRDLPRAINSLLSSTELPDRLRHEGLTRHSENYTGEAVGKRYMDIICSCQ